MPQSFKVLGQVAPAQNTATDLYTVPASTSTVISTLVIANRAGSIATYRVSVRPAGATEESKHYIAYDVVVNANDSTCLTLGITLAATDVVTVYASSADLSFSAFGSEVS